MLASCLITFHTERGPYSIACLDGTYAFLPEIERKAIIRYAQAHGHRIPDNARTWRIDRPLTAANTP